MDDRIHALIGYTMAGGSDEKVARRIAAVLEAAGIAVICRPMDPDLDLGGFDGVVLGSTVQATRWPAAAQDFLGRLEAFDERTLWCFSVGGLQRPDGSRFRRWVANRKLQRIEEGLPPTWRIRDHRMFDGAVALEKATFSSRLVSRPAEGPSGGGHDSLAVEAWAAQIAAELPAWRAAATVRQPRASLLRAASRAAGTATSPFLRVVGTTDAMAPPQQPDRRPSRGNPLRPPSPLGLPDGRGPDATITTLRGWKPSSIHGTVDRDQDRVSRSSR